MTIREFLYQIRRISGDRDESALSLDMLLAYFTEEVESVASLFPRQESFTEELTGTKVLGGEALWMNPKWVYVNNVMVDRTYATELKSMIDLDTTPTGDPFWGLDEGYIYIVPGSGTARIIGNFKPWPSGYTEFLIDLEMAPGVEMTDLIIPGLIGRRLELVRYKMLRKTAEELGRFDRAQYYLAMESRIERNLRRTLEPESTTSNGFILGRDF